MERIVSGTDMKKVDKFTIDAIGIPSLVLMERAAHSVAKLINDNAENFAKSREGKVTARSSQVIVVAGTGNNGADGLAICRMLYLMGYSACIYIIGNCNKATEDFKCQLNIINNINRADKEEGKENKGIPIYSSEEFDSDILRPGTTVVDAIFGVGLTRNVEGEYARIIEEINRGKATVYAVDVPSGVDADTGKIMNVAVKADYTVSFGALKIGTVLYPGTEYCGELIFENIGFPDSAFKQCQKVLYYYTKDDNKLIPKRPNYSNKGNFGKLLIVAGSKDISGAAILCANAAFRMGAGLVRIYTAKENREVIQKLLPEVMVNTYDSENFDYKAFEACLNWADVVAAGPGMAVGKYQKIMIEQILDSRKPAVIDADGINNISEEQPLKKKLHKNVILTPHLGEMSRLENIPVKDIADNLIDAAYKVNYAFNANCILKDARTVSVTAEGTFINLTGNNGMATAGSGDVLTGIAAGLLSTGMDIKNAVSMAPYIHGQAGDKAAEKMPKASIMARDIIEEIKNVLS